MTDFVVIARSEETKQSQYEIATASLSGSLAMTKKERNLNAP